MPSMKAVIASHNKKVLQNTEPERNTKTCNCARGRKCPLEGKCLTTNIIYKASISEVNKTVKKTYFGACATTFKERFRNHTKSFKHAKYKTDTELSKEFWRLKKKTKKDPIVQWEIVKRAPAYNQATKRCTLCLQEKLKIALYEGNDLLNKRNELVSQCRHQNKFALQIEKKKN